MTNFSMLFRYLTIVPDVMDRTLHACLFKIESMPQAGEQQNRQDTTAFPLLLEHAYSSLNNLLTDVPLVLRKQ